MAVFLNVLIIHEYSNVWLRNRNLFRFLANFRAIEPQKSPAQYIGLPLKKSGLFDHELPHPFLAFVAELHKIRTCT